MERTELESIYKDMTDMLLKKNQMYGDAVWQLGIDAIYIHLYEKVARLNTLRANNTPNHFESIEDTLKDIIGYATIGSLMYNNIVKK
jgi:hypothetical protein